MQRVRVLNTVVNPGGASQNPSHPRIYESHKPLGRPRELRLGTPDLPTWLAGWKSTQRSHFLVFATTCPLPPFPSPSSKAYTARPCGRGVPAPAGSPEYRTCLEPEVGEFGHAHGPWLRIRRAAQLARTRRGKYAHWQAASRFLFLFPASHSGFPAPSCLSEHAAPSLRFQVSGLTSQRPAIPSPSRTSRVKHRRPSPLLVHSAPCHVTKITSPTPSLSLPE